MYKNILYDQHFLWLQRALESREDPETKHFRQYAFFVTSVGTHRGSSWTRGAPGTTITDDRDDDWSFCIATLIIEEKKWELILLYS